MEYALPIEAGVRGRGPEALAPLRVTGDRAFGRIFGREPALKEVLDPQDLARLAALALEWDPARENAPFLHRLGGDGRGTYWFEGTLDGSRPDGAGAGSFVFRGRQVTGAVDMRRDDVRALSTLRFALERSGTGFWSLNLETGETWFNDTWFTQLGYAPNEFEPSVERFFEILHPDDTARTQAAIEDVTARRRADYRIEFRLKGESGDWQWIEAIGGLVDFADGPVLCGIHTDIDDRKRIEAALETERRKKEAAEREMAHKALHDALTGLPNRRYFNEVAHTRWDSDRRDGTPTAFLRFDLDYFKRVNDTLGHEAGDAVLVHFSKILRQCLRGNDFVARIGGDEFIALMAAGTDQKHTCRVAERVIKRLEAPFHFDGALCRFGASVGVYVADPASGGVTLDESLAFADAALYRAKSKGRSRVDVFDARLQETLRGERRIAEDLRVSAEHGQFVPYYQPQIDAASGRLAGLEALVRWRHPHRGVFSPAEFLPIAERLGILGDLDRAMMQAVEDDLAHWAGEGLRIPKIALNLSIERIGDPQLMPGIRRIVDAGTGVALELQESMVLDEAQTELHAQQMNALREIGAEIVIDDFGSGHASIVSLTELAPDRLKIDRRLVDPVTRDESAQRLVQAIVDIGKALSIGVIAEGAETEEHARILAELGCDTIQGYAIAHPMPAEDVAGYVRSLAGGDAPPADRLEASA